MSKGGGMIWRVLQSSVRLICRAMWSCDQVEAAQWRCCRRPGTEQIGDAGGGAEATPAMSGYGAVQWQLRRRLGTARIGGRGWRGGAADGADRPGGRESAAGDGPPGRRGSAAGDGSTAGDGAACGAGDRAGVRARSWGEGCDVF